MAADKMQGSPSAFPGFGRSAAIECRQTPVMNNRRGASATRTEQSGTQQASPEIRHWAAERGRAK
jgi:hypothetical protein